MQEILTFWLMARTAHSPGTLWCISKFYVMRYTKAEKISIKKNFSEKWLQDIIEADPSILGLGDLEVFRRERKQSTGGRIDFLMLSADTSTMYEIEIMLGATDESHIIRTIEYWDIERRRFPSREHKAVIIAEQITNRFFNVIALMNKSIPIIAIQLNALKYEDKVFLDFVKVLDIYESPEDETDLGLETVDRSYWENKAAQKSIKMLDEIVSLANEEYSDLKITYNKHHIAIGTITKNFMWLRPRKTNGYIHIEILIGNENIELSKEILESLGLTYTISKDKYITFSITSPNLNKSKEKIKELIKMGITKNK